MTTIVVSRSLLAAALADAVRIIDKRQIIPILANVRVVVADGAMTVTATDLDLTWRSTFAIDGGLAGEAIDTTIPAIRLGDILKRATGESVSLVLDPGPGAGAGAARSVTVRAGKARWTLPLLPSTDFPDPEERQATHRFVMAAADFAAALAATAYAAAGPKDERMMLRGVHIECREGKLVFVATDGLRLSVTALAAPDGAAGCPAIGIADTVAALLQKVAGAATGEIAIAIHPERLFVEVETGGRKSRIVTKLLEGTYPDWRRVLSAHDGKARIARVDRSTLAAAAARVTVSTSDNNGRCVAFAFSDEAIRLHTRTLDGEEAEDEVEATGEGEAVTVGMNGQYVADTLDALPNGPVELRVGTPAIGVRFCVPDNPDRFAVVMPMRLTGPSVAPAA